MAVESYKHTNFETSDESDDESKDKSKSKKKDETKKQTVADRGKDIWGKVIGERKDDEAAEDEQSEPAEYIEDLTAETVAEAEDDPSLEALTPQEETVVARMYAEARIDELEAGRSEDEPPAEAAARQADIDFLRGVVAESAVVELENETDEQEQAKPAISEAYSFEPDEAVELNARAADMPEDSAHVASVAAPTPVVVPRQNEPTYNAAPESAEPQRAEYQPARRDNKTGFLLLGGAVGYLIGRRRGRIQTEKRMAVVQQKLERQVEAVQQKISQQEVAVQRLARENYLMKQDVEPTVSAPAAKAERPSQSARSQAGPERPASANRSAGPRVESLGHDQLLEASSHVRFGETNLRRVYEAQLVDEAGLRRLMHEAEAGNDLRRALAREFLVKELRFERDPRLKGGAPDSGGATGGGTAVTSPSMPLSDSQPGPAPAAPSGTPSLAQPPVAPSRRRQTDVSPVALIVLTIFTLALAIYAIWLTITR